MEKFFEGIMHISNENPIIIDQFLNGAVKVEVNQEHSLASAGESHRELEGRRTTGATILIP